MPQGALGDMQLQYMHKERDVPSYSLGLCNPTMLLLPQHCLMAGAPHFGFDGAWFVNNHFYMDS